MKPLDNHKIITIAIGIFVAIVILVTVFTRTPANSALSEAISDPTPVFYLIQLVETAVKVIF